ncbi:hypothetical protein PRZ48_004930 [Zasmidium cellare]|uniref:Uncharacterized protein n=1 Tax=Zasmidium cellare TaxID=395010 RepID=A0ABR0ESA1_ZASCE|nr:hypothetical protein PRZ48_004930 [Zasmidium cellare]
MAPCPCPCCPGQIIDMSRTIPVDDFEHQIMSESFWERVAAAGFGCDLSDGSASEVEGDDDDDVNDDVEENDSQDLMSMLRESCALQAPETFARPFPEKWGLAPWPYEPSNTEEDQSGDDQEVASPGSSAMTSISSRKRSLDTTAADSPAKRARPDYDHLEMTDPVAPMSDTVVEDSNVPEFVPFDSDREPYSQTALFRELGAWLTANRENENRR